MSTPSSSSQYVYPRNPSSQSSSPTSEIDSLPDSAPSDDIDDSASESDSDAEKEWKESLQQLELILTMVLVPYAGKYFGRKCAYWGEFLQIFRPSLVWDGMGWDGKTEQVGGGDDRC